MVGLFSPSVNVCEVGDQGGAHTAGNVLAGLKKRQRRELYFPGRTRSSILLKIVCDERQNIKLRQKTHYKEYKRIQVLS